MNSLTAEQREVLADQILKDLYGDDQAAIDAEKAKARAEAAAGDVFASSRCDNCGPKSGPH